MAASVGRPMSLLFILFSSLKLTLFEKMAASSEETHPTFYGSIQGLFSKEYRECMLKVGEMAFDLWNYSDVAFRAAKIHDALETGYMPKGGPKFPKERVDLFKTWVLQGCQKGTPPAPKKLLCAEKANEEAPRYRENITTVMQDPVKLKKLKDAFRVLLADEETYRALVQIHADYCYHNSQQFFPWHRPFIIVFEDALRKAANDETMTIPYWDFTTLEVPSIFEEEPFKAFTSPNPFSSGKYDEETKLYSSQRYSVDQLIAGYREKDVVGNTNYGYQQPLWEHFTGWWPSKKTLKMATMNAHNQAHNMAGVTMRDSLYSPFDPIFWFYHCNWDRVFWGWQKTHGTISLESFERSLTEPASWVRQGEGLGLVPFQIKDGEVIVVNMKDEDERKLTCSSADVLDATLFGIAYDTIPHISPENKIELVVSSSLPVNLKTKLSPYSVVQVTNVNRLNIEGNFEVLLEADGKVISILGFLQANNPNSCSNCKSAAIVSFEFHVLTSEIADKELRVKIVDGATGEELDPLLIGVPQVTVIQRLHQA